MGWLTTKRIAAPAVAPIDRDQVRGVMKTPSDLTDENTRFDEWIEAEVGRCERVSGRALITQTWQLTLDSFRDCKNGAEWDCRLGWVVNLPAPPLISVSGTDAASPTPNTLGVSYVDIDGATQSLTVTTDFLVDTGREPGRIALAYGKVWPTTRNQAGAVTITFTAGYGATGASVPAEIKGALRAAVAYRALNREEWDSEWLDSLFRAFDYGRLP